METLALPPTVSGSAPVVGHALQFLRDPIPLLERGYQEHGAVFSLRLGNKPAVILLGPENNRFFFAETDKLLSIREGYPFFIKMFHERFYFFAEFEEYLEQRAIVLPRFQGRQMNQYVSTMVRETVDLMDQLGDSGSFDLIPTLGPLVMNIAAHSFLGSDFRSRLGGEFFTDFRHFSAGMEPVLPLWLPLPKLLRSQKAKKKLHRVLGELIRSRRQQPVDPPDFLQTLVESRFSDGRLLDEEMTINLILLLVWAGHETTAGHISWALIDLLQHPDYLQTVVDEQDALIGDRQDLSMADVRQLSHMDWAVKETERLHPVAYILMRMAAEDLEIGGFRVPKGSQVFAAPSISHRMPDVFPEPERYVPERFSPGRDESRTPHSLIGFGGGIHRCAGVNFAYLEMRVALTLLLQRYEFSLLDPAPQAVSGPKTKWPASPCRVQYQRRHGVPKGVARAEQHGTGQCQVEHDTPAGAGQCPVHH